MPINKLLVLGSSSWLASYFLRETEASTLITVSRQSSCRFSDRHLCGDVRNFKFLKRLLDNENPEVIVNFVGIAANDDEQDLMLALNVGVSMSVIRATHQLGQSPKLVAFGTAAEYGINAAPVVSESTPCMPLSGYASTKHMQTLYLLELASKLEHNIIVLRPFNLLGTNMPTHTIGYLAWQKASSCSEGETICFYYPDMIRDFVDVQEAARAIWKVLHARIPSGVYNLCSGKPHSLRDITQGILDAKGIFATIEQDADYFGKTAPIDHIVGDYRKLENAIGWRAPTSLSNVFQHLAKGSPT